jgi:hypothetical protein
MRRHITFVVVMLILVAGALVSCSKPAASPPGPGNVNVTITDSGITAAQTTFLSGVHYHFTVANHGSYQLLLGPCRRLRRCGHQ